MDYDFNEALICFHHLRLSAVVRLETGEGTRDGERGHEKQCNIWEQREKKRDTCISFSLAGSGGLNDCRGADVCCSHIKQQLVCRNKLQGYWFTLHLLPSFLLLLPPIWFVCECAEIRCVCMRLWMCVYLIRYVGFFCVPCAFLCVCGRTVGMHLEMPLCVCVCLCVHATMYTFFSKYTQWLPCARLLI